MHRILFAFSLLFLSVCWIAHLSTSSIPKLQAASLHDAEISSGMDFSHLGPIQQIAAGFSHTCALMDTGLVACWGDNDQGRLGDGTFVDRRLPIVVKGLSKNITQLVAGDAHSCALTETGSVRCWGGNSYGQLGDGTTVDQSLPTPVLGLPDDVVTITAGAYHTCALTKQGEVACWGNNSSGQLGNGSTTNTSHPVAVQALNHRANRLVASGHHTCASLDHGRVFCWGNNSSGQLGDGTTVSKSLPVESQLTDPVKSLAAGYSHTCAVTIGGDVQCWGRNDYGQLGDGTTIDRWLPVEVRTTTNSITSLAAGTFHTCALTSEGTAECWGANPSGQLGDGTTASKSRPSQVLGLQEQVVGLITGYLHTCALSQTGSVTCWGWNSYGQLGNGTTISSNMPVMVQGSS